MSSVEDRNVVINSDAVLVTVFVVWFWWLYDIFSSLLIQWIRLLCIYVMLRGSSYCLLHFLDALKSGMLWISLKTSRYFVIAIIAGRRFVSRMVIWLLRSSTGMITDRECVSLCSLNLFTEAISAPCLEQKTRLQNKYSYQNLHVDYWLQFFKIFPPTQCLWVALTCWSIVFVVVLLRSNVLTML